MARAAKDSLLFTTFRGCAKMTGRPTWVKESMLRILSRGRPPIRVKEGSTSATRPSVFDK